jgi:hypothetical protein
MIDAEWMLGVDLISIHSTDDRANGSFRAIIMDVGVASRSASAAESDRFGKYGKHPSDDAIPLAACRGESAVNRLSPT